MKHSSTHIQNIHWEGLLSTLSCQTICVRSVCTYIQLWPFYARVDVEGVGNSHFISIYSPCTWCYNTAAFAHPTPRHLPLLQTHFPIYELPSLKAAVFEHDEETIELQIMNGFSFGIMCCPYCFLHLINDQGVDWAVNDQEVDWACSAHSTA